MWHINMLIYRYGLENGFLNAERNIIISILHYGWWEQLKSSLWNQNETEDISFERKLYWNMSTPTNSVYLFN